MRWLYGVAFQQRVDQVRRNVKSLGKVRILEDSVGVCGKAIELNDFPGGGGDEEGKSETLVVVGWFKARSHQNWCVLRVVVHVAEE